MCTAVFEHWTFFLMNRFARRIGTCSSQFLFLFTFYLSFTVVYLVSCVVYHSKYRYLFCFSSPFVPAYHVYISLYTVAYGTKEISSLSIVREQEQEIDAWSRLLLLVWWYQTFVSFATHCGVDSLLMLMMKCNDRYGIWWVGEDALSCMRLSLFKFP